MKLSTRETVALIAARRPQTANEMTAALLLAIPRRLPGSRAWRRNVGRVKMGERWVRFGIPGEADVDGIVPICGCTLQGDRARLYGVRLAIEVKTPRDRLSAEQKVFRDVILGAGGIWVECRDVDACLTEIERQVEEKR